jgi:hypothetical protein
MRSAAGPGADAQVRDAIAASIMTLPEQLRRSLVWDQGAEMAQHAQLRIDTGLQVYFCDPQSPWQRGSNENTNGLLRQYFPRGTDLSRHSTDDLTAVAATLNSRLRKTLDWRTLAEALNEYLQSSQQTVLRRPVEPGPRATVAVMHELDVGAGTAQPERHLERVEDEVGAHVHSELPADNHPAEAVGDEGKEDEPLPAAQVGQIRHPEPVRRRTR